MISLRADIQNRIHVGRLTRRSEHSGCPAFQCADLGGYRIIGRVGKTSIKISVLLQIK